MDTRSKRLILKK